MTRIVVDGRGLADASAFRGIGTYLRGLLPPLAKEPGIDVTVLAPASTPVPPGAELRPVRRRAPGRFATAEHDLRLPGDLRRAAGDVVHSPALDPPRRCDRPWVQTLHDVIPLVLDAQALTVERRRWARYAPRFRAADAVIAVSKHCADQAVDVLGLDPNAVHVVHHGVDERFSPTGDRAEADPPYVLYVGEFDVRKGYEEAFAVIGHLAEAGLPHRLRVAGRIAPWVADEVDRLVRAAPRPDRIDLLGYVDHDHLPALYRGADAAVVTSRYEGFGLPAAEAMACGAPVVSFANTSLIEVVGDGGELVADGDVVAFAEAVRSILTDDRRREEAVERSTTRGASFRWERSARAHAEIFRSVSS